MIKPIAEAFLQDLKEGHCDYRDAEQLDDIANYFAENQRYLESQAAIRVCKQMHPEYGEIRLAEARLNLVTLHPDRALQLLQSIEHTEFEDERTYLTVGALLDLEHPQEAQQEALNYLQQHADDTEIFPILDDFAALFSSKQQIDSAMQVIQFGLQLKPDSRELLEQLAAFAEDKQDYSEAIRIYRQLLHLHPFDESLWQQLAAVYVKLEQWDDALQALDYAYAAKPNQLGILHQRVQLLYVAERWRDCLQAADRYIQRRQELFPNSDDEHALIAMGINLVRAMMADCYFHLDEHQEALRIYTDLRQRMPRDFTVEIETARVLSRLLRWQESYDILMSAKELILSIENELEWNALHMMICMQLDHLQEAYDDAQFLLKQIPDHQDALIVIASILIDRDQFDQVEQYLQVGLKNEPEHPIFLFYMAVLCLRCGRSAELVQYLQTLQRVDRFRYEFFMSHFGKQ